MRVDPDKTIINAQFYMYKYGAMKRGLSFDLDKETVKELSVSKCYYCGRGPHVLRKLSYIKYALNGIDRINSDKGYYKENVVTACYCCNRMKWDSPIEYFLGKVKKIYENIFGEHFYSTIPEIKLSEGALLGAYKQYARQAKRRNILFEISIEDFKKRVEDICFYCGSPPLCKSPTKSKESFSGLDRLDSDMGYTYNNTLACCNRCNSMKGTLSFFDFLEHINTIYHNRSLYEAF